MLSGCAHTTKHLKPVANFDANRYTGKWYEIARFPHRFERDLVAVTAEYSLLDNGKIRVLNRGYHSKKDKWRSATATATFKSDRDVALLKVYFMWPFYGLYKVIYLDREHYEYAVVASYNFNYLWILSRTPTMAEDKLELLINYAKEAGFEVARLELVDQQLNIDK